MNTPQRCLLHRQSLRTKQEYHLESDCCQCLHFYLVAEHEQNTAELINLFTFPNKRSYAAPLCQEHIIRDFKRACLEACTDRLIQRCFVRALRRDKNGDIDNSLIPSDILAWYEGSDDEEDTFEECSSDVEWE